MAAPAKSDVHLWRGGRAVMQRLAKPSSRKRRAGSIPAPSAVERIGGLSIRSMTRQEIALHSLQREFMESALPGEWCELPGGTHEGQRIPDYDDGNLRIVGCICVRPIGGSDAQAAALPGGS